MKAPRPWPWVLCTRHSEYGSFSNSTAESGQRHSLLVDGPPLLLFSAREGSFSNTVGANTILTFFAECRLMFGYFWYLIPQMKHNMTLGIGYMEAHGT